MLLQLLFPCARAEHPKLFGFVRPCDSVNFITRGLLRPRCGSLLRNFGRPDRSATGASRTYLIKHAHTDILFLKRRYYTLSTLHTQLTHPILSLLGLVAGFGFLVSGSLSYNSKHGTRNSKLLNQPSGEAGAATCVPFGFDFVEVSLRRLRLLRRILFDTMTGISFQSVIFSSFHCLFTDVKIHRKSAILEGNWVGSWGKVSTNAFILL